MLTMALNGANGTTKAAMETRCFTGVWTLTTLTAAMHGLLTGLTALTKKLSDIANSIWIRDGFNVLPDFIERNRSYLDSEVRTLDFSKADAAGTINNWISQKTNNLIRYD